MRRTLVLGVVVVTTLLVSAAGHAELDATKSGLGRGTDLRVELDGVPDSITVGNEPATYTVSVVNQGRHAARGVRVVVALPAGLRFAGSAPIGCHARKHAVSCAFGWIPACGGSARTLSGPPSPSNDPCRQSTGIDLRATRSGSGRIAASVFSKSRDLRPSDDRVVYAVGVKPGPPVADLSVAIDANPDQVAVGGELHYTMTVTNHGPDEAMRVTTRQDRPSALALRGFGSGLTPEPQPSLSGCGGDAGGRASVFCVPRLSAGASVSYQITVLPGFGALGTAATSVNVSSSTYDPTVANNSGVTSTSVVPPAAIADLGLTLAATPNPGRIGQPVAFTATVTNYGPDAAESVELHSEGIFDGNGRGMNGLRFAGVSATQGSCDLRIVCALGRIEPGQAATVTINLDTTSATPGDYGLAATALSPTFDPSIFDTAAAPDGFAILASLAPK